MVAPTACRRMVSGTISLPSSGCFSPFPHGTRTLSVSREYLALPDGPGGFTQGSTCPALLRIPVCPATLRLRSCHPLRRRFPAASPRVASAMARSYYPGGAHKDRPRFGLFPVRSPLLGESLLFVDDRPSGGRVVPFGDPRIKGHLHLPAAYRSLSRPSSPP